MKMMMGVQLNYSVTVTLCLIKKLDASTQLPK